MIDKPIIRTAWDGDRLTLPEIHFVLDRDWKDSAQAETIIIETARRAAAIASRMVKDAMMDALKK